MAHVLLVNPSSHKKRRKGKRRALRRNPANPVHHKRRARRSSRRRSYAFRRYRRNPSALGGLNMVTNQVMPVALGAAGAIATDMAIDKLPLPITWKLGNMRHVAKAGVAVGLGMLTGAVAGKDKGTKVMAGALVVVAYDALKGMLARMTAPAAPVAPAPVAGMGFYPELDYDNGNMGLVLENGVGAYDEYEEGVGELLY